MLKQTYLTTGVITASLLGALISGAQAHAADGAQSRNAFNADATHPDISTLIDAFELVCMPFVLHQTELTQEANMRHMAGQMERYGYALTSTESKTVNMVIEPHRFEWRPPSQEVIHGQQTIVMQTGEVNMRPITPAKFRAFIFHTETYTAQSEPNVTATLDWNFPSQDAPGKACTIALARPTITPDAFKESFIAPDEDWKEWTSFEPNSFFWTQCFKDGDTEYKFTAQYKDKALSLSMRRSDFFDRMICAE